MKKLFALLLSAVMLLALASPVFAADDEATAAADALYALGLFKGTGTNEDGTPIYDLKPYVPYADSHPDAAGGFTDRIEYKKLSVEFPPELLNRVGTERQEGLIQVLEQDPRDAYEKKPEHVYGMIFGGQDIRFTVSGDRLTVVDVADRGSCRVKQRHASHREK